MKLHYLWLVICFLWFLNSLSAQQTNNPTNSTAEKEMTVVVEEMPSFPGGEVARMKFLADNINYPEEAMKNKIQGTVSVSFNVSKSGKVSGVKIYKGIGGGCDEEVKRVVKLMPRWNPGTQDGKPVKVRFVMSVNFKL